MTVKRCPILIAGTYGTMATGTTTCLGEECAWWGDSMCSIPEATLLLSEVQHVLQAKGGN